MIIISYQITIDIDGGNWGAGNFPSVAKPIIREILEPDEIALIRFFRFKRIIICKQASTLDFEKGLFRGKEAIQSSDFFLLWLKEATRAKFKALYDKTRDILIEDNDQTVYDWYEVSQHNYDPSFRGRFISPIDAPWEVTAHKAGKSRA